MNRNVFKNYIKKPPLLFQIIQNANRTMILKHRDATLPIAMLHFSEIYSLSVIANSESLYIFYGNVLFSMALSVIHGNISQASSVGFDFLCVLSIITVYFTSTAVPMLRDTQYLIHTWVWQYLQKIGLYFN